MSVFAKILALLGALAVASALSIAAVASYYWVHDGTIDVRIRPKDERGDEVSVRCPAALARIGLAFVPAGGLRLGRETRSAVPAVREVISQLRRCPDAIFVETRSRDERVRISKRGDLLVVEADTPGETVYVAVPLATADAAIRAIRE